MATDMTEHRHQRPLDDLVDRLERAAEQLRSGDLERGRRRRPRRGLRRRSPAQAAAELERHARARRRGRAEPGAGRSCCERARRATPRRYPDDLRERSRPTSTGCASRARARRRRASRRRCATRCSPAASASGRCSRSRPRAALGRDPDERAAARGGARADPHLLADPRRPAGDGRRRPAPRPPDLPRRVRRGRRDPRRRRALRRGVPPRAHPPAGRARARARRASPSWPPRPASTAWSAASTSTSTATSPDGAEGLRAPARAEDRPADRARRSSACCSSAGRRSRRSMRCRVFARELGVLFQIVDDILDVTGTDAALGKPQRQRRAARQAHLRERVRPRAARASWPRVARQARASALDAAAPGGAAELEQITDFIATRTA